MIEQDNQIYISAYDKILQFNESYIKDNNSDNNEENMTVKMCKYKIAHLRNAIYGSKKVKYTKLSSDCKYIDIYTNQHGEVVHFGNANGSQKHTNAILKNKAIQQEIKEAKEESEKITKDII